MPGSDDERMRVDKDYPHTKKEVSKQVITSKLKAICLKYRQSVDSRRKSGHGRVVMLYSELCERVWGGSSATEQVLSGMESTDLDANSANSSSTTEVHMLSEDTLPDEESENPLQSLSV